MAELPADKVVFILRNHAALKIEVATAIDYDKPQVL